MTPDQLRAAITFANGIDPRIQMTGPNAELWGRVVGHKEAAEVKAAILVYYERYPAGGRENPPITASVARRIIHEEGERAAALTEARAIGGRPLVDKPSSFRSRNPAEWDRLVLEGRDDYRTELRARGIEPHAESCEDCQRDIRNKARQDELKPVEPAY